MPDFEIAIIGAGIAGASLAWRLAPRGRVLLAEAESQPGMHSTGRSAAMFMESYGPPQVRALTRASRAFYVEPPPAFSEQPILAPRGALYAAWDDQLPQLDAFERELADSGCAVERLDAGAALAVVPVLRREGLIGALHETQAMDIDVHALHQAWLRGARQAGAACWLGAQLSSGHRGSSGRWHLRFADGREADAGIVVDAAGAWADEVAARCGVAPLMLQPKRRSAFTFDAPTGVEHRHWPTVCGVDESWYIKPDAGQLLGSPANADPVPPHDVQPEELDIATGIARIEADTTLRIRRPRRTWAGLRTFAPDGELVIGFDTAAQHGFFWLAAHGGYGIQSAAGASALAACLIEGRELTDDLMSQGIVPAQLSPARFGIR